MTTNKRTALGAPEVTIEPHNKAFHYASLLLDELDIRASRPNEALRYALIEWIKAGSDADLEPPSWMMGRPLYLPRRSQSNRKLAVVV